MLGGLVVTGIVAAPTAGAVPVVSNLSSVSRGVCTTSLTDANARAASFTVKVANQATASSYGFAASLQERTPRGRWTTLTGDASPVGLGPFQPAAQGAPKMIRKINVRGLRMGSSYRLKVNFRWTLPDGTQSVTVRSESCAVKELRPNLKILNILGWLPGTTGNQVVYRVRVGASRLAGIAGRMLSVSVRQGTTVLGAVSVRPTAAKQYVLVPGTRCDSRQDVTYRVDGDQKVEESNLADNESTLPCL